MSSTLPLCIITFHFIHSLAQFNTTTVIIQNHHTFTPTLPPSLIPTTPSSSHHTHKSLISQLMSHEAPVFIMVIVLLVIVICACICFLRYKHLIIKTRNKGDSIESDSENENDYESTTKKTISLNNPKHHSNNNSDPDVLTKGAFITNSAYGPTIPELSMQNSIIQNTNAIYGINTDAIIQSPSVIVIKHNTEQTQQHPENKNDLHVVVETDCAKSTSKNIFDSPPSNVFIDSPDSVIMDDVQEKNTHFVFVNESQLSEPNTMNTYDSIMVCNGSIKSPDTYASEGQLKRGRNSIKNDDILKHLKKNINDQLDENEFEVIGSPPLSPITETEQ